eukprot:scaffold38548_cov53-Phaeocystis_antarctica.AAC.6
MPSPPIPPESAPWPRGTAVRPQPGAPRHRGDGLTVGPGCPAQVLVRVVPDARSQQLFVLVARQRGQPGSLLRDLAIPLLRHPAIFPPPPLPLLLLVIHYVQLHSAR